MTRRTSVVGLGVAAFSILLAGVSFAGETVFDFKDPKGVNTMSFWLESVVEPIMGLASGVSGTVRFDPDDPRKTSGRIVVDATTLHVANERMKQVLHSADWMHVERYPTIEFSFKEVKEARKAADGIWEMTVLGDFTCKGTTRPLTLKVRAHHLPGKLSSRLPAEGDLLVLRTEFKISRKDFDIQPDQHTVVVSDEIEIRASIVGCAPKTE
jgi:polyisoprenoid-binding protein YceI